MALPPVQNRKWATDFFEKKIFKGNFLFILWVFFRLHEAIEEIFFHKLFTAQLNLCSALCRLAKCHSQYFKCPWTFNLIFYTTDIGYLYNRQENTKIEHIERSNIAHMTTISKSHKNHKDRVNERDIKNKRNERQCTL